MRVTNGLNEPLSVHWHGITQVRRQQGTHAHVCGGLGLLLPGWLRREHGLGPALTRPRAVPSRPFASLPLLASCLILQRRTNIMDGVVPVTQRGVQPGGESGEDEEAVA